ncbi:DUF2235 domain-containing protein [Sphingomonas sp. BK580]|uniref:DUF2235 domain-containing protein n=1 Tax=Sphingomonas sp. BK580 TaxID=2586972 RepID=UPI00160B24C2|nr:DUF2235 domain-containing protein [Sphingomonas sp. BK580]MBB3695195.1 hypothetical protein [Sphingomonas sp. BK580]
MKRIALFLDGTWNKVETHTNVERLFSLVAQVDGVNAQCAYYEPGVGTKQFEWLRGGALGYGLSENVLAAYEWLVSKYDDGDEIYIFGFSRGAFTARSLAGLIAKCGLLHRGSALSAVALYERYQLDAEVRPRWKLDYVASQGGPLSDDEKALLTASKRVPIKMIGVWDTVGALGIPFGNIPGLSRRRFLFHHTRLSTIYENAFHALAIDEHREAFRPALWTRFVPRVPDARPPGGEREPKVEQRWFVGAHADVGGGNPTPLPELPMRWLAMHAHELGLRLTRFPEPAPNAISGPITDSYGAFAFGLYRFVSRPFVRTIGSRRVATTTHADKKPGWSETVNETIDGSVFDRWRADPTYRPAPVVEWAGRLGCEPAKIFGPTDAVSGKPLDPAKAALGKATQAAP